MKNIIIAEKPSVAMEYAKALGVSNKHDGYLESDNWIVTWTVGHLISMSYPEKYSEELKKWDLEHLPFIPEKYKYEVIPAVNKQFQIVKGLYHRKDIGTIYYAGDSGREGLYIQMLVREYAGHTDGVDEKVVWIDSQTQEEILRGIRDAKDVSCYDNMTDAGYMRAIADYLIGINFSRLYSVKYGVMLNSGSGNKKIPISVGRVMTCVLGMITRREHEIKSFRVTPFFRVVGLMKLGDDTASSEISCMWKLTEQSQFYDSPEVYETFGFLKRETADRFVQSLPGRLKIDAVERKNSKKNAPLLYNLDELQGDCAKLLNISPKQTLNIAQQLYEKKMTTYPRTDARVLTSAISREVDKNLRGIGKNATYAAYVEDILSRGMKLGSKFVDDAKVTDHYAIIPTGVCVDSLSELEAKVYDIICRRFLAAFYPPAEYEEIKLKCSCGKESFDGSYKMLSYPGYYEVSGVPENEKNMDESFMQTVRNLREGDIVECSFAINDGKTAPPKRYSLGSLILAMVNAGKLIEDDELREQIKTCGIGTPATRADTVDKLLQLKYIEADKKQIVTPTKFGEMICEVVNMTLPDLLNAEMTAQWEMGLNRIASGEITRNVYENGLNQFVRENVNRILGNDNDAAIISRLKSLSDHRLLTEYKEFDNWDTKIVCPLCGSNVETTEWGFKCVSNISKNEGCSFSMPGSIKGHRLLTKELATLLKTGSAGPFFDFYSEKGIPFGANMLWDNQAKKLSFELVKIPWDKTDLKCPGCGGNILKKDGVYACANNTGKDSLCSFYVGKIAGKRIPDKEIEALIKNKRTGLIRGFKNKDKKAFDAFLVWNEQEKKIDFEFPTDNDIKTKYRCPICQGNILSVPYGFACENHHGEDGCSFVAGSVLNHKIKEKELEEILYGRKTDLISFKKKDGKTFLASLYWDKEKQQISFDFEKCKPTDTTMQCPRCQQVLQKTPYGYKCSSCDFFLGKIAGVMIEETQMRKLCSAGKTDLIQGFKNKDKKVFSAYLCWDKEKNDISFEFPDKKSLKSEYTCPNCRRNKLNESSYGFYCEECGFKVGKVVCEKEIPMDELKNLFAFGQTGVISGLWSAKKRSYFSARLKVDGDKTTFVFEEKGGKEKGDS